MLRILLVWDVTLKLKLTFLTLNESLIQKMDEMQFIKFNEINNLYYNVKVYNA